MRWPWVRRKTHDRIVDQLEATRAALVAQRDAVVTVRDHLAHANDTLRRQVDDLKRPIHVTWTDGDHHAKVLQVRIPEYGWQHFIDKRHLHAGRVDAAAELAETFALGWDDAKAAAMDEIRRVIDREMDR